MIKKEMSAKRQAMLFVSSVEFMIEMKKKGFSKNKKGDYVLSPVTLLSLAEALVMTASMFKLAKEDNDTIKKVL